MQRRTISVNVNFPDDVDWPTAWQAVLERVNGAQDGLMLSAVAGARAVSLSGADDGGEMDDSRRRELLSMSGLGCATLAGERR